MLAAGEHCFQKICPIIFQDVWHYVRIAVDLKYEHSLVASSWMRKVRQYPTLLKCNYTVFKANALSVIVRMKALCLLDVPTCLYHTMHCMGSVRLVKRFSRNCSLLQKIYFVDNIAGEHFKRRERVRSEVMIEIEARFENAKIEMPFPHIQLVK